MFMDLKELLSSNLILMECISGSHMYGTNRPESDKDIRGIFKLPKDVWHSLQEPSQEVGDEKHDIKYYELRKYFKLASDCNPNIIELLFVPKDCLQKTSKEYDFLVENRKLFISKKAFYTYSGYSWQQIRRSKGQNKKVNRYQEYVNEKGVEKLKKYYEKDIVSRHWIEMKFNKNFAKYICGETTKSGLNQYDNSEEILHDPDVFCMRMPIREDYCFWISDSSFKPNIYAGEEKYFPARPEKVNFSLTTFGVSSVEHTPSLYRLYKGYDGVFKNGELVCTSISKDREWSDFVGLLYYNENEYQKAKSEYDSFWEWNANKNSNRWTSQEKGEMDYDCKNLCHCHRLLLEAKYIATIGEPKVRYENEELKYLQDIRSGKLSYEEIIAEAERLEQGLKDLFEKSEIPNKVNHKKIDELYKHVLEM